MTKDNVITLERKEERIFNVNQQVIAVLHQFVLNKQISFTLIQNQQGVHIPRHQSGKGSYQFIDQGFKDYIVTMITTQKKQGEFLVAVPYLQTYFQILEPNERQLAVGELNCYNLLKIPNIVITQRENQQLALQFPGDYSDEYQFEQSLSARVTTGYTAKTLLNQFMLQEIQQKVDMKRIAEQYVQLRKTGKSYCGYSPFRSERTASFHVFPDTNTWYDFGMSEGGDAISFIRKKHDLGFSQAVSCLYEWSKEHEFQRNYQLPEQKLSRYNQEQLLETMNMYQSMTALTKQQWPQEVDLYRQQRNFSRQTWEAFQVSWIDSDLLAKLSKAPEDMMERFQECGLVHQGTNGQAYFKMKQRLAIPLHNEAGVVVAYNGRVIQDDHTQPKYLLTHNTAIYQKSQQLFNYHRAKEATDQNNCLVLCEGAFDVMRCHEVGIENSVALLGSSLSETQLTLLKKIGVPIVIVLDNDEAGRKASYKIQEQLTKAGIINESYEFSNYKDLDELLQDPKEVWQFKMILASKKQKNMDSKDHSCLIITR